MNDNKKTLAKFRAAQGRRQERERLADPRRLRKAAAEFRAIGWMANAKHCDLRAEYWDKMLGLASPSITEG